MSNAIDDMIAELKKNKTPVLKLTDDDSPCIVHRWISSGVDVLDMIISDGDGNGGLPVGRIVEIYGDASTGKSLLAIQAVVEAQASDIIVLYVDTESAISMKIMGALGVDLDRMMYQDPNTVEDVFQLMENAILAKAKKYKDTPMLIIWDSVAATTTKAEAEAAYDKSNVASQARAISQGMRKIVRLLSDNNVCLMLINQTRENIGVMFGDDESTSGGKAIGYYASVRIRLKYGGKIKADKKIIGIKTRALIAKNKVGVPFRDAYMPIYFGYGVDNAETSFEFLKDAELLEGGAGGNWTLKTDAGELKFKTNAFADVYEANRDAIIKIMKDTL